MSFCSNCGNPVHPDAKFCECCGAKITVPRTSNPEDATSCFLPEGNAGAVPFAAAAAVSMTGGTGDGTSLSKTDSLFADPVSSGGPIWLNAKPEEPKKPPQPFFATGPDAAYHAPEESIPMPAAPVPNVPIWMSRKSDLPEDLDGLSLDDIDPQTASPIDEVSWRAKRSGPVPPKKGFS